MKPFIFSKYTLLSFINFAFKLLFSVKAWLLIKAKILRNQLWTHLYVRRRKSQKKCQEKSLKCGYPLMKKRICYQYLKIVQGWSIYSYLFPLIVTRLSSFYFHFIYWLVLKHSAEITSIYIFLMLRVFCFDIYQKIS